MFVVGVVRRAASRHSATVQFVVSAYVRSLCVLDWPATAQSSLICVGARPMGPAGRGKYHTNLNRKHTYNLDARPKTAHAMCPRMPLGPFVAR